MVKKKYIAFEGVAGNGKSTQSRMLVSKLQKEIPDKMVIWTREPGGSEIALEIRRVVQGMLFTEVMEPICEQYLYAASRAQTLRSIVGPVLKKNGIVVSDRSVFTSMAFQGFGRKLGIEKVLKINELAVDGLWPDLVIYLDVDLDTTMARMKDKQNDKFELMDKEFFKLVESGYMAIAKKYKKIFKIVDGKGSEEEVGKRVWNVVKPFLV